MYHTTNMFICITVLGLTDSWQDYSAGYHKAAFLDVQITCSGPDKEKVDKLDITEISRN